MTVGTEIASLVPSARTAVLVRVAALINLATATSRYTPWSAIDAIVVRNQVAGLLGRRNDPAV